MRRSEPAPAVVQILALRLGAVEFGIEITSVHGVLRPRRITAVPKAPAFVEGVIELRGALIPIIDMRRRFELPYAPDASAARLVLVQLGDDRVGVLVDSVVEVLEVPEDALAPPPAYFRGLAAEYIRAIARLEGRLIIVIDLERILTSEEQIALEQAAEWLDPDEDASSE